MVPLNWSMWKNDGIFCRKNLWCQGMWNFEWYSAICYGFWIDMLWSWICMVQRVTMVLNWLKVMCWKYLDCMGYWFAEWGIGYGTTSSGHSIGGPTNGGYPNKPSWLKPISSLMIRGLIGKDPFGALARWGRGAAIHVVVVSDPCR